VRRARPCAATFCSPNPHAAPSSAPAPPAGRASPPRRAAHGRARTWPARPARPPCRARPLRSSADRASHVLPCEWGWQVDVHTIYSISAARSDSTVAVCFPELLSPLSSSSTLLYMPSAPPFLCQYVPCCACPAVHALLCMPCCACPAVQTLKNLKEHFELKGLGMPAQVCMPACQCRVSRA
jgi:hypothetical protein